jgi:hypothetical protein
MKLDTTLPGDSFNLELTHLQMRMRQQAREIISNVFLSEEETRNLLEDQMVRAINSLNWEEIIRKELQSNVSHQLSELARGMTQGLMWDKEIQSLLKAKLIERLKKEE